MDVQNIVKLFQLDNEKFVFFFEVLCLILTGVLNCNELNIITFNTKANINILTYRAREILNS